MLFLKKNSSKPSPAAVKRQRARAQFARRIGARFGRATEWIEHAFKDVWQAVSGVLGLLSSIFWPHSLRRKVDQIGKSDKARKLGQQVGELSESVEKEFSRSATSALEVAGLLFSILVPKPVRTRVAKYWSALASAVKRAFRRFGRTVVRLAERFLPAWMVRAIRRTSVRLGRSFRSSVRFSGAWWSTRDFKKLAWSTPAILMAVPLLTAAMLSSANTGADKIRHYARVVIEAERDRDYAGAELFRQKLQQLGYMKMELEEYRHALNLAEDGELEEAYAAMKELAPLDPLPAPTDLEEQDEDESTDETSGFVYAHLWIAMNFLLDELPVESEHQRWDLIEQHTIRALALEPNNHIARYFNIRVLEHQGKAVIGEMEDLARAYPEFNAQLMQHYQRKRKISQAKSYARKYIRYATVIDEKKLAHYVNLVQALQFLGEQAEAERIAVQGSELFPNELILRSLHAGVLKNKLWSMALDDADYDKMLVDVMRIDPTDLYIVRQVAKKLVYDEANMRFLIDDLKEAGRCPNTVFLIAGEIHAGASRWAKAEAMFREAIEVDPENASGHNNVAWVMANAPPLRLTKALERVNRAIELSAEAQFFETRGQIYVKLRRWQESADDLERAVNGSLPDGDRRRAHQSLVLAYEKLGHVELAAAHRLYLASLPPGT